MTPRRNQSRLGKRSTRRRSRSPDDQDSPNRRDAQVALGVRIKSMRKAKGLPQDVLARKCGISTSLLGEIERGHKNFHLQSILRIAKGLETTVSDLFAGIA